MQFIIMGLWFLSTMLVVKGSVDDIQKEREDHRIVAILKTQKVTTKGEQTK